MKTPFQVLHEMLNERSEALKKAIQEICRRKGMKAVDALDEAIEALDKAMETGELTEEDFERVSDLKQRLSGMREIYI